MNSQFEARRGFMKHVRSRGTSAVSAPFMSTFAKTTADSPEHTIRIENGCGLCGLLCAEECVASCAGADCVCFDIFFS